MREDGLDPEPLVHASRLSAKVDNSAVQDGTPFPVDRVTYDKTIEVMRNALNKAAIDRSEKVAAFRRLSAFAARNQ